MVYGGVNEAWIVGAVRTPVGRHGGILSTIQPDDLGALVLQALMERTGVPPSEVEDVELGLATNVHRRRAGDHDGCREGDIASRERRRDGPAR